MIISTFTLNIFNTLVTGKSPSATTMRSCLWSRLWGQEVTVKGEFQCALLSNICSVSYFFLTLFCTATYALCMYNCLTQWKLKLTLVTNGFPNLSCSLYCQSNTFSAAQLTSLLQCKVQSAKCKVQLRGRRWWQGGSPGTPIFPPRPQSVQNCPHCWPPIGPTLPLSQTRLQQRRPLSLVQPNRWSTLVY